ncbi:phage-like protein [Rhizobium rhizogenes]|uniref:Phage related protein n=1 Tax=Rhizobium rhizogenes (strain K84 / ATCC BAA-868) TaxID=311403 RepID=B9JBV1_RHIR8|nr:phage related protein [Rhizobium rhizogenes K84]
MARPRKNPTLRLLEGAQRSKVVKPTNTASNGVVPVGDPPLWLTGSRRDAWYQLALELGNRLTYEDRALLEIAATIRGDMVMGDMGVNKMALLRQTMKDLGASPVDRQRLNHKPEEKDPLDDFFGD